MTMRRGFATLLSIIIGVCTFGAASFAKPAAQPACGFNGNYSFFFWSAATASLDGVGFFTVQLDPATGCRSGVVLPGGILNCYLGDVEPQVKGGFEIFSEATEDFIEGGSVFLETDGEGTMLLETNSSDGICGTSDNAIELDVSVVLGGKSVLFNSDGESFADSGLIPQAGYQYLLAGRADKCFAGQISGCYNLRFWSETVNPGEVSAGDCTVCVDGAGAVTGGTCRCNAGFAEFNNGVVVRGKRASTLSEIEAGGYTLGENCQSSTGYLWFVTSSDEICDVASYMALDFAVAQDGKEIVGTCDTAKYILNDTSEPNAGVIGCAFEGWLQ